jgi:hypothetical protein
LLVDSERKRGSFFRFSQQGIAKSKHNLRDNASAAAAAEADGSSSGGQRGNEKNAQSAAAGAGSSPEKEKTLKDKLKERAARQEGAIQ